MVRLRPEARGLQRLVHAPERAAGEQRAGALDDGHPIRGQPPLQQLVETRGVELAQREVVRIREVHDDGVEEALSLRQELHRVRVDDPHLRVREGVAVERGQFPIARGQPGDGRIQVHQRDGLHLGIAEHLARRQPISAPQDEHPVQRARAHQGRMHQGLVVAVLVDAGELQVAVEKQREAPLAPGDDDALVGRVGGVHHLVRVELVLVEGRQAVSQHQPRDQEEGQPHRLHPQPRGVAQHGPQKPRAPQPHQRVEQPEEQRGAHQSQLGHEEQRKGHTGRQRPQVVERQHLADQVLELDLVLEDAQQQGNLQPHQCANRQHAAVQRDVEDVRQREGEEQHGGTQPSHQRHPQLDLHEALSQPLVDEARQVAANAHREEVATDDGGELGDGVPQQVAGQRPHDELVDEPTRGDDQDGDEQQRLVHVFTSRPARGAPGHPEMADATMMASPRMKEPMTMPSAVFWSASISLFTSKGRMSLMT
ncbi:conserved hypothetical protein [Stigmatella aurantiaca DW4/3-1]|uniref:Uncharacterized protein n=1 Tax=Stigmatella aurantiaca (strain DW4/3-1) TaxID=378806 RepID=Q09CE9_STIAD|nr:conserved hypothetical protein [Stigmatella aurantiaca DW4/3-1]